MNYASPLTLDEAKKVKEVAYQKNVRYGIFVSIGFNTNLRVSDIIVLKWSDLILDSSPRERIVLTEKKTGKRKIIYINETLGSDLKNAYDTIKPDIDDYIFDANNEDGHWSRQYANRILGIIKDKTDIKQLSPHSLRKTFARTLYDRCGDINIVAKLLNHSSSAITLNYLFKQDEFKDSYERVNI